MFTACSGMKQVQYYIFGEMRRHDCAAKLRTYRPLKDIQNLSAHKDVLNNFNEQ